MNIFIYNLKQEKKERVSKDFIKIKLEEYLKEQKEDLEKLYEEKKKLRLKQIEEHEKYYQQQIEDLEKYYQDKQNLRLEYITELKKISGLKKWNEKNLKTISRKRKWNKIDKYHNKKGIIN